MSIFEKWKQVLQWSKIKDKIGEPPWEYDFLYNLPESEYPKYLKKIYRYRMGEELNLNHPKTFNEKMQWLKLYDASVLKRYCTDKVRVREYVKQLIGEEYLKPVFQICDSFEKIDFEVLPNEFVIKCNHGCKWQYIIKSKEELLSNKRLYGIIQKNITGWMEQEFWPWEGFEMQYKGIEPKIMVEPLLRDDINRMSREIQMYCFGGEPGYIVNLHNEAEVTVYDGNLRITTDAIDSKERKTFKEADAIVKQTYDLSKILSDDFKFVRVDWLVYKGKPYFGELTFTPYSGFQKFKSKEYNINFGNRIDLEKEVKRQRKLMKLVKNIK